MSDDDVVTARSGAGVAYEWTKHKGYKLRAWESQRIRYWDLLSARCVAEAVRISETEYDLWARLNKTEAILEAIAYACAPSLVRKYYTPDSVPEGERKEYDRLSQVVWVRHDPVRVYNRGYDQAEYPGVDRKALAYAAAEYLDKPWLRVPVLDWMIVDALVTDEIINYGDSLKATYLPGPSDPLEKSLFFQKTGGNVQNILREGRKYKKHPVRDRLVYQILFPAITIGIPLYFQYWKTALAFIALTILDWILMTIRAVLRAIRRMRATAEERRTPEERDYGRLAEMMNVHRLLEGPVVNPTLLREEMVKTTNNLAYWEPTAWAIVDRVIRDDAAVWITSFPSLT